MPSNFEFIKEMWPDMYREARKAERTVYTDPRISAMCARTTMECTVKWIYHHDNRLNLPYETNLINLIRDRNFKHTIGTGLFVRIDFIRKLGNETAHTLVPVDSNDSLVAVRNLQAFMLWTTRTYSPNPPKDILFKDSFIPKKGEAARRKKQEREALEKQLREQEEIIKQQQAELDKSRADKPALAQRQKEIQAIRENNERTVPAYDYTEEETRRQFIDLLLREAGWDPTAPNTVQYPVTHMPEGKTGKVDYVLWGDDGKPLAIIEAKRTRENALSGQQQAVFYADALEKMTGQRPVIFLSNGYQHWLYDDKQYPCRSVQGFYTKDQLERLIQRRTNRKDLTKIPIDEEIVERRYHIEGIRRVDETFTKKKRRALIVMATGAGKTRFSIALVKQLMQANWAKRVLFLADRITLVKQARSRFKQLLSEVPQVNLLNDKEDRDSRIVFSTYPTMMNCIDHMGAKSRKRFGVGHFDLIIVDEAHRSVYLKYRAIFDYFDALLVGLTATPRDHVDRNTFRLFDTENQNPTFFYELDEAVEDGYLVPPRAMAVPLKFPQEGVHYLQLSEQEKEEYEAKFYDHETGQLPPHIDASAINAWLFNRDTVEKVLAHLMTHGYKIQGGDKLGKTIIFAVNRKHAHYIKDVFDSMYPHLLGEFMLVIEHSIGYVQHRIEDFAKARKNPVIAVSVDMLDTGIDVHEILNLVFFKVVRSRAKFWQMIGRGTRTCKNVFGPGKDKKNFIVFDFCDNFSFFDTHPKGIEPSLAEPLTQRIFKKRFLLSRLLTSASFVCDPEYVDFSNRLIDHLHCGVDQLDITAFTVRPKRKLVEKCKDRSFWETLSSEDITDIETEIAPLVLSDDPKESARRFDLLILELQVLIAEQPEGAIGDSPQLDRGLLRLVKIVKPLQKLSNIPKVAAHMDVIDTVCAPEFRETVTILTLEDIRRKIRDLVHLIHMEARKDVYVDFEDEIGEAMEIDGLVKAEPGYEEYRSKVERYLRENSDQMTILKLRTNVPITRLELQELERMLFSHCDLETREEFYRKLGTEEPLGRFIRSIVGMEKEALRKAFANFLHQASFSGDQVNFINHIVDYYHRNGYFEVKTLFEAPFTDYHTQGPFGVFDTVSAGNIIDIINGINGNAVGF